MVICSVSGSGEVTVCNGVSLEYRCCSSRISLTSNFLFADLVFLPFPLDCFSARCLTSSVPG